MTSQSFPLTERRGDRRVDVRRRADLGPSDGEERRRTQEQRLKEQRRHIPEFIHPVKVGPLDIELVSKLIDVRPPYFALKNLSAIDSRTLRAEVYPEQPLGNECPPIQSAEAGRHLAILGSVIAGLMNPRVGKTYYLACSAELKRLGPPINDRGPLLVEGRGVILNRRRAKSETSLFTHSGASLYSLTTYYQVINDRLFDQLFSDHRQDLRTSPRAEKPNSIDSSKRRNPYTSDYPLEEIIPIPNGLEGRLGPITSAQCNGHFPMTPVLPVAILMSSLASLVGKYLEKEWSAFGVNYSILSASIRCQNLVFPGEKLTLKVCHKTSRANVHLFYCHAAKGNEEDIGNMWLKVLHNHGAN